MLFAERAGADTLRLATWNVELTRAGPGVLLRDLRRTDPQAEAVARIIADHAPDILLLKGVDHDADLLALMALQQRLAEAGHSLPHSYAPPPNSGLPTGHDLDGDGRLGEPEDAQGFGRFRGEGGMALLSRYPIQTSRDLSGFLWADLPGALLHDDAGRPLFAAPVLRDLRLASVAHWQVTVAAPGGAVTLLAFHAGPPVFDGPEDRNGRRNHDQLMFWQHVLAGALGPMPQTRFALIGDANQDPQRGEGRKAAIRTLLGDPRLQDPHPSHSDGKTTTVDWPQTGPMRVDYILPSRDWQVAGSGVYWPDTGPEADRAQAASRHHLVWVDLRD
ncbi:endonuclease/exonuclease/phosphatase family protein [Roseovarius sp. C7]|uniref:endonuclease/exonuclease/phosphatase family protein n=1 Tax=Roseovarius sp. C7 TaxID=3398643 RepID=UPI0039F71260